MNSVYIEAHGRGNTNRSKVSLASSIRCYIWNKIGLKIITQVFARYVSVKYGYEFQ